MKARAKEESPRWIAAMSLGKWVAATLVIVFFLNMSAQLREVLTEVRQLRYSMESQVAAKRLAALDAVPPPPDDCVVPIEWVAPPGVPTLSSPTLTSIPGYQGWVRAKSLIPPSSFRLTGDFETVHSTGSRVHSVVGDTIEVTLRCAHPLCRSSAASRPVLAARALGPSPLHPPVIALDHGEFVVPVTAFDAGLYKLEIYLAFSNASIPLSARPEYYEGVEILSAPLKLDFGALDDAQARCGFGKKDVPTCRATTLWKQPGRWHPIPGDSYTANVPAMAWFPTKCRLQTTSEALALQQQCKAVHAVLVGDSLMDLQHNDWKQHWRTWSVSGHGTHGGLPYALKTGLISKIDKTLTKALASKRVAIMINSGLHDVDKTCNAKWKEYQIEKLKMEPDWVDSHIGPTHCVKTFRESMATLLDAVRKWQKRGAYVVWRTTAASLMPWGNINARGVWVDLATNVSTGNQPQSSFTYHVIEEFLENTRDTVEAWSKSGVGLIDGWNTTISRADHGQIGEHAHDATIHFGPEVSNLHNKMFVLMASEHFGCGV